MISELVSVLLTKIELCNCLLLNLWHAIRDIPNLPNLVLSDLLQFVVISQQTSEIVTWKLYYSLNIGS
jgi:hypothetical protein